MQTPTPSDRQTRTIADVIATKQTREIQFAVTRDQINVEARTVPVAFASELPYERWWGTEILDVTPKSVRLGRLNGGAAVLVNHGTDQHVGVVASSQIDRDAVGRAVLRFGKSPEADVIFQDVVDGIRSLVSVGYQIHEMILEKSGGSGDIYRVTDWEPFEISIVSIPADPTVGVGRGAGMPSNHNPVKEQKAMQKENPEAGGVPAVSAAQVAELSQGERDAAIKRVRDAESLRLKEINAIGDRFKDRVQGMRDLVQSAINNDTTVDAFRAQVMDKLVESGAIAVADSPNIGMSNRDLQRFSFCRALLHAMDPHNEEYRQAASFEIECSNASRKRMQSSRDSGIAIPYDMLVQPIGMDGDNAARVAGMLAKRQLAQVVLGAGEGRRDLVVGTDSAGGYTVSTDLMAGSFIDLLTNALAIAQVGATMLTDLNGNIAIPRQTAGATGYWVAESGDPTESAAAFDQVAMMPKTVGAFTDYSRRLLLQSSLAVEAFVRMDLARTIALALDLAGINGSGSSNQPTGVLNTSGIGSVAGGTNGAAPDWDAMVNLEAAVGNANAAMGRLAYLTNTKVRGKLKRTQLFDTTNGQTVWQAVQNQNAPIAVSNQVPSNLTKGTASGVCSAIVYGNWLDLIVAMWGSLDLMMDPYTGATSGTKRLVALQDVDINVRQPTSFAAQKDALTT